MDKGFVGSLFDFSFSNFVTGTLVKFIYGLSLCLVGLLSLGMFVGGLFSGEAVGVATALFVTPIFFALGILYARVMSELTIVVFRIFELLQEISSKLD